MVDTVDSKSTAYTRGGSSPLQSKHCFLVEKNVVVDFILQSRIKFITREVFF